MPVTKRGQDVNVPVSPIYIKEHKIGYKPVLGCRCGSVLDTNKTTYRQRQAWTQVHELCVVTDESKCEYIFGISTCYHRTLYDTTRRTGLTGVLSRLLQESHELLR